MYVIILVNIGYDMRFYIEKNHIKNNIDTRFSKIFIRKELKIFLNRKQKIQILKIIWQYKIYKVHKLLKFVHNF